MAKEEPHTLEFAPEASEHLRGIERRYQGLIAEVIERQLPFEPEVETTNRKPLRVPILDASGELRLGPKNRFRVFYSVRNEDRTVLVLAVGEKRRDRLRIAGKEYRQ